MSLSDDGQQRTILIRKHLGKALGRGEPYLRLVRLGLQLATRNRHRAGFHVFVRGDSDFQSLHEITPFSRSTASTVFQKSASKVSASRYSYGRTALSRCL